MALLEIRLLGPFQASLSGEPITGFESQKVRALLAYLAAEADRPRRRETLAGLLWPVFSDRRAHDNLRSALKNLRQTLGDRTAEHPLLLVTRDTIQFNLAGSCWLDVAVLGAAARADDTDALEEAAAVCRGDFLEGFSCNSAEFEEWVLCRREQFRRQVLDVLRRLTARYLTQGDYVRAVAPARRQVELEPWDEEGHQTLMQALVLSGQRGLALAQYETCRRLLKEELEVGPARQTRALYESIRDGALVAPEGAGTALPSGIPAPVSGSFVARERELARLEVYWQAALTGCGHPVFVTGEAGSGKTALMREFARRAMAGRPNVIVTQGRGNAHTGAGDPYLPLLDILHMLSGDVEALALYGAVTSDHAARLWALLPEAARALQEAGSDLVDRFVPGAALLARAERWGVDQGSAAGGNQHRLAWITQLETWLARRGQAPAIPADLQQADLFEQYTHVLQSVARRHPLILIVDDLQWADAGSLNLLFHLGRRLAGHPILILGAYRPEDVSLGRAGARHPLEPIVHEFEREWGDIRIDLMQADGRRFVEALVDSQPNCLPAAFREMLYQHTGGQPLFTVELLRGLQERGDLLRGEDGKWQEGPGLQWELLPPRVEAVIAERIGRLPAGLQRLLTVASVQGEEFLAEVVASASKTGDGDITGSLSEDLGRRQGLLAAAGCRQAGGKRISIYRFKHYLYQKYLYRQLDPVERARLHEATAFALQALYERWAEEIAVPLARHFELAGLIAQALDYYRLAGERAVGLFANQEAIGHFVHGIELLRLLPEGLGRDKQELALQLALGAPLQATKGYASPDALSASDRARELCYRAGEQRRLLPILFLLTNAYHTRAEYWKAQELAEELANATERVQEPYWTALGHGAVAANLLCLGRLDSAQDHVDYALAVYDACERRSELNTIGLDPAVFCRCWAAWVLWLRGYPDAAARQSQEGLALAHELGQPVTECMAMMVAGASLGHFRGEHQAVRAWAEAMRRLSAEHKLGVHQATAALLLGWLVSVEGRAADGLAQMRDALAALETLGNRKNLSYFLGLLADAHGRAGRAEDGLEVLDTALVFVRDSGEQFYEAELLRLKGELLLAAHDAEQGAGGGGNALLSAAEASLRCAIDVARRQNARSWELRSALSLGRFLQAQGRAREARPLLAEIYGQFTEGFDTCDLQEARAMLSALDSSAVT
jgi:DNA-binding SARP family transcriptional activator/predicted ATPase